MSDQIDRGLSEHQKHILAHPEMAQMRAKYISET